jgi:hypothetical protein
MRARVIHGGRELSLDGEIYTHTLASLHLALKPRSYLEIGVLHGDTLALALCPTVGVDPAFQITQDVEAGKPSLQLFETTSDDFFARNDLRALLGGPVGMAFLDGMHQFDFLLRDFINTEAACDDASVVLMHDCLPRDALMTGAADETAPSRFPGYWTGDVWKIVPVLRQWRPDLDLSVLDALPTGLGAVTRLNPASTVLKDNYDAIVAEWAGVSLADYGLDRLARDARIQPAYSWRRRFGPEEAPGHRVGIRRRIRRLLPF